MFTLQIQNVKNEMITLTQDESNYQVFQVDGLNPPKAQINLSQIAGLDGSQFNSSKLETRNIVIYIKLNGNIEKNRLYLNTFFSTKHKCKIFYKNESRNVYIEGFVESNQYTSFTNNEIVQVSIICPNPYFKNVDEIVDDISKAIAAFHFPFAINIGDPIPFSTLDTSKTTNVYNDSESETGVIIEVDFYGSVNTLLIRNTETGEAFTLNYPFKSNDQIIIDTNKGEKSITLIREGSKYNIFTAIRKGSTFFQLSIGDNFFSYLADNGQSDELVHIVFKHYTLYEGV